MKIVLVRRISQVFFLALFLWFCAVTTLGTAWWQLRGWPVNWFLQLDPLVALGTLLTTRTFYAGLIWALVTVVLTILLGRFFCGWVCPFGTLHQWVGHLGRRGKHLPEKIRLNAYRKGQSVKYFILIFLLSAAAGDLLAHLTRLARGERIVPWVVVAACVLGAAVLSAMDYRAGRQSARFERRRIGAGAIVLLGAAVWTALAVYCPLENVVVGSLQSGWLDPIALMHRSVNLVLLPLADRVGHRLSAMPRLYEAGFGIGLVFIAALFLNLWIPRFYCRFVCPLGALLGVLGRFAIWRIGKTHTECSNCKRCQADCEGACEPDDRIRTSECVLCMNCLRACDDGVIGYQTSRSASGEITTPDVTRRGFLVSLISGLVAGPSIRLSDTLGMNWNPRLLRPPGSLAEPDFLARCVKCGQCMRICPTNIIQPAGLESGLEAVWSPTLNYRIGTSGCQANCVACGQICPTAAIRPITLDERLGRKQFAEAGPIRIGTAFVDRGRCLPWAMDRACIVCQENCPVSPKAIFIRESFNTVRIELPPVSGADELTVEFGRPVFPARRYATGDYYLMIGGKADVRPRRIVENTATGVTVDSTDPWDPAAQKGDRAELQIRLQQPCVDPERCIGCGICEHECPVTGIKAICVTAENESRNRKRSILA